MSDAPTKAAPVGRVTSVSDAELDPHGYQTIIAEIAPGRSLLCGDFIYSAPSPPSACVKVKDLEWRDRHDIPLRDNDLLAESVVGQYTIRPSSTGKRFRLWMPGMDYNNAGVHFTVESAKIDAQKHYETRIRSSLA